MILSQRNFSLVSLSYLSWRGYGIPTVCLGDFDEKIKMPQILVCLKQPLCIILSIRWVCCYVRSEHVYEGDCVYNNLGPEFSVGLESSICLESPFSQNVVCLTHLRIWRGKSILVIYMYRVIHLFGLILVLGILLKLPVLPESSKV